MAHSQSLLVAPSDQQEPPQCDERVSPPAPHEASAEVRQTGSHAGTGLLPREGGREVGGATLATQLHRAQGQRLHGGRTLVDKTEGETREKRGRREVNMYSRVLGAI